MSYFNRRTSQQTLFGILLLALLPSPVLAHGDEDHSADTKSKAVATTPTTGGQRWEISSPEVELLGILQDGKLTLYADHYASNAPLLDAKIELESGGRTVQAEAAADGSYRIAADWLKQPGKHEVVVSVRAGELQDLLISSLEIPAATPAVHARTWLSYAKWLAGGVAGMILLVLVVRWRRRKHAVLIALPLLAGLLLIGQTESVYAHGDEDHSKPATTAPSRPAAPGSPAVSATASPAATAIGTQVTALRQPDGSIFVPKPMQRLLGIRTIIGTSGTLAKTLELDGRVIADPNFSGRVQSSQTGRLAAPSGGFPAIGTRVRKGQILAYIEASASNIEKGNQQAQLAELSSNLTLAENRARRLAQLVGSLPQKEIDAAQAEAHSLKARKAAVAASLFQREALPAPVSGVISLANGVAGQVVEAREILFEVIDPARLRVEAIAYDNALGGQVASAVGITLDKQTPQQSLPLRFLGQSPQLREQALPLQFEIETPTPTLNVGQTLKVLITTRQTLKGIAVPRNSVLKNNRGEPMLWTHTSAERFVPQRVTVQALDGDTVAVLSGLHDGTRVVTQGVATLTQIR